MDDRHRELLRSHIDGTLDPRREPEIDALLATSPEARRYVAEHRFLWDVLGEACPDEPVEASATFRERAAAAAVASDRTSRRVLVGPGAWRWLPTVAAALLLVAALLTWRRDEAAPAVAPADREVVRYLHVLRHWDLLETYGEELDLRADFEVLRAFEGEMEDEG